MIKNYFTLNRFIIEVNKIIEGNAITAIFSQEKDKLIIETTKEELSLEISVNPGNPFISLRKNHNRAKKNTVDIFPDCVNQKIQKLQIADDDRIIKIILSAGEIYFTIRGKFTNVIYLDKNNSTTSFKKLDGIELVELLHQLQSHTFIDEFNRIDLILKNEQDYFTEIKKKYPIIGTEIIKEAKQRFRKNDDPRNILEKVLNNVSNNDPVVFIDSVNYDVYLAFEGFDIFNHTESKTFSKVIEAQNYYHSKKFWLEEKHRRIKLIKKYLERELDKVSNKINNLRNRISAGSKEENYKHKANLLLMNIGLLKPRMKEITLADLNSGENLKVKLDTKISPKKNIDAYFDKAKSEKINFQKSNELLIKAERDYNKLIIIEESITIDCDLKELEKIMKELKIKSENIKPDKEDLKEKFKHYLIDQKYHLFVGKDSKNNDLLTTKFAKQNDYWFHARSVSGSHVVLRVENTKEAVSKNILKKAASIAAYHSKAKTAGVVPVAYTLKKYVAKKKGDPVGTVRLLKEEVLLVKPEIPNGCVYLEE